jgi:hypothetical protein
MYGKVMVTSHMLCSSAGDDLDIKNAGVRASVELKETSAFEEKGATNERKCDRIGICYGRKG